MAIDFRDGKTFPRRGREQLGAFLWLARLADKAHASANGTIFDYIYPCPMDKGVLEHWGVTSHEFDGAIQEHPTDSELLAWAKDRIPPDRIKAANAWVLTKKENLDRQDSEEGIVPTI